MIPKIDSIDLAMYKEFGLLVHEEERIIKINGEITNDLADFFNSALLALEKDDPGKDISVYINSPGGDVVAGLSMIDTMKTISCDVSTVCRGLAASMGAMILMSGEKGKRRILPHSTVLIHQPLGGTEGQAADIEIYAREIKRKKEELFSMICSATGQSMDKVAIDCDRNYIMTAKEAKEYGIVDEIIEPHFRRSSMLETTITSGDQILLEACV